MLARSFLFALALAALSSTAAARQVLYESDFESDDGGFYAILTNDWEHGVPTSGPGSAFSGTQCWGTDLDDLGQGGTLLSPSIDATAAAGTEGILVSWWQFFDDPGPPSEYRAYVRAHSPSLGGQHLFGRRIQDVEVPFPTGWHRIAVRIGPEFALPDLELEFLLSAAFLTDGMYIDDVRVEVLRGVTIGVEDFETSDGGFTGGYMWSRGVPQCFFSFPTIGHAATGQLWGTGLDQCLYEDFANSTSTSPIIDLGNWSNRREVYLAWQRMVETEFIADGVHHEISYDGGNSWVESVGSHSEAYTPTSMVGFGLVLDPSSSPLVKLRWRMKSDSIEVESGAWIDNFQVMVPERVLGAGANPADSLDVTGSFALGGAVQFAIDDPGTSFTAGSVGVLALSLGPDPGLPDGTSIPGWGMSAPGAAGDYLIDATSIVLTRLGTPWAPGSPSLVSLNIPNDSALLGLELWTQAVLVDLSGPLARFGLTNGLFEKIGS